MAKKRSATVAARTKPSSATKRPTKKKPAAKRLTADQDKERAALQARIDQLNGKTLTKKQRDLIDWLEKSERSEAVRAWIQSVPKGEYCRLAGRQHKLVDDAARTYDLPLEGPTVDLQKALAAFHNFIAKNANRLRADLDEDKGELEKTKLRQQIIGIEYDNEDKHINLQYTKGRAIPREVVAEALVWLSGCLQNLGADLGRIDPDARIALNEALEKLALEIEEGRLAI